MPRVISVEAIVIYYKVRASRENARRICYLLMDESKFPDIIDASEVPSYDRVYTGIKIKFWDYKNLDRNAKNVRKFIESINLNDIQHINPRYIPVRAY